MLSFEWMSASWDENRQTAAAFIRTYRILQNARPSGNKVSLAKETGPSIVDQKCLGNMGRLGTGGHFNCEGGGPVVEGHEGTLIERASLK